MKQIWILQDAPSQPEENISLIQPTEHEHAAEKIGGDVKHMLKSDKTDTNGLSRKFILEVKFFKPLLIVIRSSQGDW